MHEGHTGDGVGNNPVAFYGESVSHFSGIAKKDAPKADAVPRNA